MMESNVLYAKLMERGKFQYSRVKAWTTGELRAFNVSFSYLALLLVPCHTNDNHSVVSCIYLTHQKIVYYDPLSGMGKGVLPNRCNWLASELVTQKVKPEVDVLEWPVDINPVAFPRQKDSVSFGIFVTFVCEALRRGEIFLIQQRDIPLLCKKTILFLLDKSIPIEM